MLSSADPVLNAPGATPELGAAARTAQPQPGAPVHAPAPVHTPAAPAPIESASAPPGPAAWSAPAPEDAPVRPSVEQVIGELRGAVTKASKREPYPWFAVASLAFTVVWLLWPEGGSIGAAKLKLWTVFVLTSSLMVFIPMLRNVLRLDEFRAWQIAVAGAGGLGFAWVAFLLPSISTNQAFFGTFGIVLAALAAWTAPGKPAA